MSNRWYITRNGKQRFGPFTGRQLKDLAGSGKLVSTDMVLLEGKHRWVAACSIKGLFAPTPITQPVASKYPMGIPVASPLVPVLDLAVVPENARLFHGSKRRPLVIACGLVLLLCFLIFEGVLLINWNWPRKGSGPFTSFSGESTATKPVEIDNLRMDVLLVVVHKRQGFLRLYILAENTSDTRLINFVEDFTRPAKPYEYKLTDEFGNKYHLPMTQSNPTIGFLEGVNCLRPKEFVIFELGAYQPVDKAKVLYLELSSLIVHREVKYHFKMPIKQETVTYWPKRVLPLFKDIGEKEKKRQIRYYLSEPVFRSGSPNGMQNSNGINSAVEWFHQAIAALSLFK